MATCILFVFSCNGRKDRGSSSSLVDSISLQPVPITEVKLPIVSVYLENSGSMNGYVNGNTGFKQSIYYYLTELQDKATSFINLYYINSIVIPQQSNVKEYILNSNPLTFSKKGVTGTSDIAVMLDTLLRRRNSNEVALFISDCIVSPNKAVAPTPSDIDSYLLQQRTEMTSIFGREIKRNKDLSVVICQLQSHFDGKFFNKINQSKIYKGERPFYLWLIGSTENLKIIMDRIPWNTFKDRGAEIENLYVLTSLQKQINYAVINADCWGSFKREHSAEAYKTICKVKKENKGQNAGKFKFSLGIDLSGFLLDRNYLLNTNNYVVNNNNYTLEVKEANINNFSHQLSLITEYVSPCNLTISLKNKFPEWVNEKTDYIGQDIIMDKAEDKTYGLKYLIEGVHKAFVDANSTDDYTRLTITIK